MNAKSPVPPVGGTGLLAEDDGRSERPIGGDSMVSTFRQYDVVERDRFLAVVGKSDAYRGFMPRMVGRGDDGEPAGQEAPTEAEVVRGGTGGYDFARYRTDIGGFGMQTACTSFRIKRDFVGAGGIGIDILRHGFAGSQHQPVATVTGGFRADPAAAFPRERRSVVFESPVGQFVRFVQPPLVMADIIHFDARHTVVAVSPEEHDHGMVGRFDRVRIPRFGYQSPVDIEL